MRKRLMIVTLVIALMFGMSSYTLKSPSISINGKLVEFTANSGRPFVDSSNRTQVPFRQVLEAYGAIVNWDQANQMVLAEKDGILIKVPIGTPYIYKNNNRILNDTEARIYDGRTYLPIRVVLEAFGASVSWDNSTRTVLVKDLESIRFAVLGDTQGVNQGLNVEALRKTLASIKTQQPQPSFAVLPGDMVQGESASTLKEQLLYFNKIVTEYYPISFFYFGFGNHEGLSGKEGERYFKEVFSEMRATFMDGYENTVYYFDKDHARFYMLNASHPGEEFTISDTQLNWIKENTNHTKTWNFYFVHEPAYPTGPHVGWSLDRHRLQRNKLWEVIDQAGNAMVFSGHEHSYTRRHINSDFNETINGQNFSYKNLVYQITVGTSGAEVYEQYSDSKNIDVAPVLKYHYAIVDVDAEKVRVTAYALDGKVIDQFEQKSYTEEP